MLYCARHDYGTRILARTGNLAAVMKTMGHRDVKTAMHYQHPEPEIVGAALDYCASANANEVMVVTERPCGTFQVTPQNRSLGKVLKTATI